MFAMQCDPTEFLIARGCWIINQVFCNFVVCVGSLVAMAHGQFELPLLDRPMWTVVEPLR